MYYWKAENQEKRIEDPDFQRCLKKFIQAFPYLYEQGLDFAFGKPISDGILGFRKEKNLKRLEIDAYIETANLKPQVTV